MPVNERFLRTVAEVLADLRPGTDEDTVFQRDAAEAHIRELLAAADSVEPPALTFEQWYAKYAHWDSTEEAREAYEALRGSDQEGSPLPKWTLEQVRRTR